MRIAYKLILGFLSLILLILGMGYYSIYTGQEILKGTIGKSHTRLAEETLDKIDRVIHNRIEIFAEYARTPIVRDAVSESNLRFEEMEDIQDYIDEKDREWISMPKEEITPFMQELISAGLSERMRRKISFYEEEQEHKVYSEVFVTNKYGANVAQTGRTTDYRQNDEEWWQAAEKNGLFISDVDYDRNAKVYSITAGIAVEDGSGNFIGAMKVVLNIDEAIRIIKEIEETSKYKGKDYELITKNGKIIYSTEKYEFLDKIPDRILQLILTKGKSGYFIDKGDISGDSGQLQEVFLNIMLNAIQAMPEGGKLSIRSHSEEVAEYGRRKSDVFKPGQKIIVIEIKDTGKGMDGQTLAKVFDPFFTTKEENTGLGLSISYGIIRNHNGVIEVASKPGKGSTFFVKLPIERDKNSLSEV